MQARNKIKVIGAVSILTAALFSFVFITFQNPLKSKAELILPQGPKVETSSTEAQKGAEIYFSLFKFISNLSPLKSDR